MRIRFLICIDDRFPGGTSSAIIDELKVLAEDLAPNQVALLNVRSTIFSRETQPNKKLVDCLASLPFPTFDFVDGRLRRRGVDAREELVSPPPSLDADFLVVHNPLTAFGLPSEEDAKGQVHARSAIVVAHQPYIDANGVPYYALGEVIRRTNAVAEQTMFAPIGPLSRQNMLAGRLAKTHLAPFDWPNVFVDTAQAAPPREFSRLGQLTIGRHSRSDWVKWPSTREEFETVYQHGKSRRAAFLGWGPYCNQLFPEGPPSNWTTHAFGDMPPEEFLRSIDVFVYYHHQNWVEGFGRTVAEALFSGAPCLLQPSMQDTFSGLAFYAEPDQVADYLSNFDSKRDRLRDWSRFGRQLANAAFGPARIRAVYSTLMKCDLDGTNTVARLMEAAATLRDEQFILKQQLSEAKALHKDLGLLPEKFSAPARVEKPTAASSPQDAAPTFVEVEVDIAIYTDMRSARSDAWRAIELAECFHRVGRRVALVHVQGSGKADFNGPNPLFKEVSPEILMFGLDSDSDPDLLKVAIGCVLTAAHMLVGEGGAPLFARISRAITPSLLCIVDRRQPTAWFQPADNALTLLFGVRPKWAISGPTDEIKKQLTTVFEAPELRAFVSPRGLSPERDVRRLHNDGILRRGRVGLMDAGQWRQTDGQSTENFGLGPVFVYATPHAKLLPADLAQRTDMFEFRAEDISYERFLDKVDIITYFPGDKPSDLQMIPLLRAVQSGVLVIADGRFKPLLGSAVIYSTPDDLEGTVGRYAADRSHLSQTAISKARNLAVNSNPEKIVQIVEALLGGTSAEARSLPAPIKPRRLARKPAKREILFFSSNGVGLGHLTRLMSIARRLEEYSPVFVTMSQAFGIIREAGWPVKYFPFHEVSGCNVADWNQWLAHELSDVVRHRKGIDAIVFDGSNPYSGLLSAGFPAHMQKIWIQRGMWKLGHLQPEHIRRGRHFDMIIEPADIAESTAEIDVQSEAFDKVKVDPIWLLENDELLDRAAARRELGLTPDGTYCIVQLGSGTNRDIISMIDTLVRTLRARKVKICIAEWLMGSEVPRIWPDVTYLRIFPLSRYFRAFDFAISAAGYNSFHELIGFEVPTIFIANEHQTMDDQEARAKFAMENDAAVWVAESDAAKIEPIVELMLQPDVRDMMVAACRELKPKNGAVRAARIIEDLSAVASGGRLQ